MIPTRCRQSTALSGLPHALLVAFASGSCNLSATLANALCTAQSLQPCCVGCNTNNKPSNFNTAVPAFWKEKHLFYKQNKSWSQFPSLNSSPTALLMLNWCCSSGIQVCPTLCKSVATQPLTPAEKNQPTHPSGVPPTSFHSPDFFPIFCSFHHLNPSAANTATPNHSSYRRGDGSLHHSSRMLCAALQRYPTPNHTRLCVFPMLLHKAARWESKGIKHFCALAYNTHRHYFTPKAHPQLHFQLTALRKAVMKAVAKEHSDVIERLQTQTVNSTL